MSQAGAIAGSCKKKRRPEASLFVRKSEYVSAGAATPTPYAEADQRAAEKRERCRLGYSRGVGDLDAVFCKFKDGGQTAALAIKEREALVSC